MKRLLLACAIALPSILLSEGQLTLPNIAIKDSLIERGSCEFRRFGFHVYDAKLWTKPNQNKPPYVLQLKYAMNIKSSRIVDASLKEMKGLAISEEQLSEWETILNQVIPTVKDGDVITGVHTGLTAEFYLNDKPFGQVNNVAFADDFFAIWLSPNSSDVKFRKKLLQQ